MKLLVAVLLGTFCSHYAQAACAGISNCDRCINPAVCDTCADSFFKFQNGCVDDCDGQSTVSNVYYPDFTTSECLRCHSTCDKCFGSQASDCIKCKDLAGYLYQGACRSECPDATFSSGDFSDLDGRVCLGCASNCKVCSNRTTCSECSDNFFMDASGACISECGEGFGEFESLTGGICVACNDSKCLSCQSAEADACLSCEESMVLLKGRCVQNCTEGYFLSSTDNVCPPCSAANAGCALCSVNGSICTECDDQHFMNSSMSCVAKTVCGQDEYMSGASTPTTDRVCSDCTRCVNGTYLTTECDTLEPGICSACLQESSCTDPGLFFVGTCSHDRSPSCKAPAVDDPAPASRAIISTILTLSGLSQSEASAMTAEALRTALVGSLPNLLLSVFDLKAGTSNVSAVVRIMPLLASRASAAAQLESVLAPPRTWLSSLDAAYASAIVQSSEIAMFLPSVGPPSLSVLSIDSVGANLVWGTVSTTTGFIKYQLHVLHLDSGQSRRLETTSSQLDVTFNEGPGLYQMTIAALYDDTALEPGLSPSVSKVVSAPSCGEGCLLCTSSKCLNCNNVTASYQQGGDGQCFIPQASSSSSSCMSLGSSELCGSSMILFIVGMCVLVMVLVLLVFCCCTHRRVVRKKREGEAEALQIKDVHFVAKWKQREEQYRQLLDQHAPLGLDTLETKITLTSKLEDEFDSVPQNQVFPDELPPHVDDRNRSPSILPNIHSRVFLAVEPSSPSASVDEYINANFVRGFRGEEKSYIVTQAPSPTTTESFWRMVWDQDVEVIVQLHGLIEEGKVVCTRYWPTKAHWHKVLAVTNSGPSDKKTSRLYIGNFSISLKSEKITPASVVTTLRVRRGKQPTRTVRHMWFLGLPSSGVPKDAMGLHQFVADVRNLRKSTSPIVVHCSTGVERSSLFVGADMIQNAVSANHKVDILHYLCQMRQDRGLLLDTLAAIGFYKQQSRFLSSSTGLFHTPNPAFMDPEAVSVADSLADDTRAKDRGYTEVSAEEEPIKRMKKKNRNKGGKGNSGFAEEAEWSLSSGTDDDEMSEMVRLPRRTRRSSAQSSGSAPSPSTAQMLPKRSSDRSLRSSQGHGTDAAMQAAILAHQNSRSQLSQPSPHMAETSMGELSISSGGSSPIPFAEHVVVDTHFEEVHVVQPRVQLPGEVERGQEGVYSPKMMSAVVSHAHSSP